MYQITNYEPPPPSSTNPQVPVMLDYIIAKVLAKAPEARYQSAADLANDLRECRLQMEGGTAASLSATAPIPIMPALAAAAQKPSALPAPDATEDPAALPPPTKGISRAFDSHEATSRLMRQISADGTEEFVVSPFSTSALRSGRRSTEHPWGPRENAIFAATVIAAMFIATAIVLL
jgi:hypothetical protein